MNEKISNKLLAIPIALTFSIIAIFCFFCIGLSRVDAASYEWDSPRLAGIYKTGGIADESQVLVSCNLNSSSNCNSLSTYDIVSGSFKAPGKNYYARYRFNDIDGVTYIPKETYSVSYKVQFALVNDTSIASVTPVFYYYPNSANNYGLATCDTQETSSLIQIQSSPTIYEYTYNCSVFKITADVSWLAFGFQQSENLRYVNIIQNLRLGGPGETQDIINNQNQNTQDIINNATQNTDKITDAIEKSDETNQGILETITNFFSNFFEGLIGIFVPSNFDFLTGFLDTLENKLGFIASVPIQFLEFLANLVTIDFDTVTSVTLPNFEILGYKFIEEQEIDLSEIMAVFQPYRIYTNIGCVCLCIRYLMKLYENFANKE